MLHVGLDLSRKRVDVCLISDRGELVDQFAAPADRDGLYGLTRRVAVYGEPVRGVVESMNGARFVHDKLVAHGWEVLIADAPRSRAWRRWRDRGRDRRCRRPPAQIPACAANALGSCLGFWRRSGLRARDA
jgi:hypothetical protein